MSCHTLEDYWLGSGISDAMEIPWAREVKLKAGVEPYEHQYSGLNLIYSYERAALYDQTGTGKSLPLQAYCLYRAGEGHKIIGLMPPVLLKQFYTDIKETFVGCDEYVSIEIFRGTKAQRDKQLNAWKASGELPDILLMTYDLFRGMKSKGGGYGPVLKSLGYNIIVADEAQALRNSSSATHKSVYNFVGGKKDNEGKYGLILSTGTPSHTHLEQNYGLIRLITPRAYGTKAAYERTHIIFNPHSPYREITEYINYDVMITNLYARARRVEKKDVAKNLPDKLHTVVPVDLDPKHKKLYRRLLDERLLELESGLVDATQDQALRQMALRLVSNPEEFSDTPIKNNMIEAVKELVNSIDLERTKVIIFIHFISTADKLMEEFSHLNMALLNGTVTDKDAQVNKFLHDDTCRGLVAHVRSAGAGLNLQSVCSDAIFYECPDSPGDLVQAEDRIHRLTGTDSTVNIYFLSPTGTWAAKKIRQVQKKDAIINNVVGDKQALLGDLFE